ncbi:homing endonuclease associated repeat-containing protein [Halorubrum sp. Atlit-26R]|uniref:homing endonuclease associated repeat-containing protein n=1 Tax=Halorubrum sp. Atlit-26R TaxID=2282128 RepID=UPI000EF27954|nr:hypothetical protein [Halorubrum sp. Atlit-26R]RLM68569.1 hypothetical protein DVK07_10635 [Halorubrum sp. Atlit-26R]
MTAMARIELLSEVRRLKHKLGSKPTLRDIVTRSSYSRSDYSDHFDSWSDVLLAAGYPEPGAEIETQLTPEILLADLHRVAEKVGGTPTVDDVPIHGDFLTDDYRTQFGTIGDAMNAIASEQPDTVSFPGVPRDDLIAEITRVHDKIGRVPRLTDMDDHGEYPPQSYIARFGSWSAAVESAGYNSDFPPVPKTDLIEEIHRLRDELGEVPTAGEMEARGEYSMDAFTEAFGNWGTALQSAGYTPNAGVEIPEQDLLTEIDRLHDKIDRTPRVEDMSEHGEYSIVPYLREFGSWSEAIKEAGYTPVKPGRNPIPEGDLLEEIHRLHDKLGRPPKADEMDELGEYSAGPYRDRFGSWDEAVKEAGYTPVKPGRNPIPEGDLLEAIHRLHDKLGRTPKTKEMDELGEYSAGTYQDRFGSWSEAIKEAGYTPNNTGPEPIPEEDLLSELHRLYNEVGRVPKVTDMMEIGEYSPAPYRDRFGGWNEAVEKAGLR